MELSGRIIGLSFCIALLADIAVAEDYVINTYDLNSQGYPRGIKTLKIDLETNTIIGEIPIGQEGQIVDKRPISISRQNDHFLITAVVEKCFCDNTSPGDTRTRISIINASDFDLFFSFIDEGMIFSKFERISDSLIYIDAESQGHPTRIMRGDYTINNNSRFRLVHNRPPDFYPDFASGIGRFDFLEPVSPNNNIYKSVIGNRRFLLKTDEDRSNIIDSLEIDNTPLRNIIIGIMDSLIYIFHQNYEFYSNSITKTQDEDRIQDHALIYNISDFALLDSVQISGYPEGDYISAVFDVADKVGDYLVYYNFEGQGLEKNAPAMLFIFDTRTNEASWLRVGWR